MTPAVEFQRVSKTYGDRVVLAEADGAVAPGEVVVLLGPSGSGKSTLVTLAAGMDAPDAGSVRVAGQDLAALSERGRTLLRRRRIGLVFQNYNLIPELTVRENVLLRHALDGTDGAAQADALLTEVGLAGRGHEHPDHLSGGEQQRVAVAAALIHAPDLVLADEPTGALDTATAAVVVDLLVRLTRGRGGSLIFVTHNPDYTRIADRVWRLTDGKLA
jgi:putative ABC transport system ATP-binding protein